MSFDGFKAYLDNKECVKIICGAGNRDFSGITNLCALYSSAGCRFFDVNPSVKAIRAAKEGIILSGREKDCFICVSLGTSDDPHFVKCRIDSSKCKSCGSCEKVCLQNAIKDGNGSFVVNTDKCIGCGRCIEACKNDALETSPEPISISDVLPALINEGIDCVEYHIITEDENGIMEGWKTITDLYKGPVSVCVDRSKFGNERIQKCLKLMKDSCDNLFIVQADGAPMSGGEDDYRTTLQAVAMADIIDKTGITPYIFISGGTNSKTAELAKLCGLDCTGVSIGSYARKIVKEYIENEDFLKNKELFGRALERAKSIL